MADEGFLARDPWWVARQKVSLDALSAAGGALWWLEDSPRGTTTRLMRLDPGGRSSAVTPPAFSVGGWLHGYGGGGYAVSGDRAVWLAGGTDSGLLVAQRAPDGSFEQAKVIAGGTAESVVQPAWGPDGALYYMSDRSGWWNLYRWDGQEHQSLAPMDHDCAAAPWAAGYRSFAFLPGGATGPTASRCLCC
jgi:hypothetical protein